MAEMTFEQGIVSAFCWQNRLQPPCWSECSIRTHDDARRWLFELRRWGVRPVTEWMDGNA